MNLLNLTKSRWRVFVNDPSRPVSAPRRLIPFSFFSRRQHLTPLTETQMTPSFSALQEGGRDGRRQYKNRGSPTVHKTTGTPWGIFVRIKLPPLFSLSNFATRLTTLLLYWGLATRVQVAARPAGRSTRTEVTDGQESPECLERPGTLEPGRRCHCRGQLQRYTLSRGSRGAKYLHLDCRSSVDWGGGHGGIQGR